MILLRSVLIDADGGSAVNPPSTTGSTLLFYAALISWYTQVRRMPTRSIIKLVRMGGKLRKLVGA